MSVCDSSLMFQTLAKDYREKPLVFCSLLRDFIPLIMNNLKSSRSVVVIILSCGNSQVQAAFNSITLWATICKDDFEGVSISLWQGLTDCCIVIVDIWIDMQSSKRSMAVAAEKTMIGIVTSCLHSSSLFSTILSFFYTVSHATARLVLMHCIGEAVRCWNLDYVTSKQSDILQIVLTGLKDRTGEVREASRIVFCMAYCRLLPSLPDLQAANELDEDQGLCSECG